MLQCFSKNDRFLPSYELRFIVNCGQSVSSSVDLPQRFFFQHFPFLKSSLSCRRCWGLQKRRAGEWEENLPRRILWPSSVSFWQQWQNPKAARSWDQARQTCYGCIPCKPLPYFLTGTSCLPSALYEQWLHSAFLAYKDFQTQASLWSTLQWWIYTWAHHPQSTWRLSCGNGSSWTVLRVA